MFLQRMAGPLSKSEVVRIFARILTAADIPLTRPDECGREVSRLHGHVVRADGSTSREMEQLRH